MTNKSKNLRQRNINVKKIPVKSQPKTLNEEPAFFEKPLFIVIIIFVLTFIAFFPSLMNDFIPTWDDHAFITGNLVIRQLTFTSIKTMFTTPILGAYVPLPLLSFAIEYHFFGLNPLPYHISNLILHLGCTFLVFYFFRLLKLDIVYAGFGALLFGIHPMHVESVAWVTERKDLLYTLFYLCSMIFYLLYIQKDNQKWKFFCLSILFFIVSLFSKIQAVALPLSLILLDYYLERPLKSKLILEKVPFFILSLLFGIAGILILKSLGALQITEIYTFSHRIFFGFYALSAYIFKFFAPFHLSLLYPFPLAPKQSLPLLFYLNLLFLLLLGFLVYRSARFTRVIVFGSLFFFFNILFLLQIITAGSTYLADRYSYIPYIGLLFIVSWLIEKIVRNKKGLRSILFFAMSLVVIVFISLTFNRCKVWGNAVMLWTDVIEKYPNKTTTPYMNRGITYASLEQWNNAISDYSKALELDSSLGKLYSYRGDAYAKIGQWDKVISDHSKAIELDPDYNKSYINRGFAYGKIGQPDKAINDYIKAIKIDPNNREAYYDRGNEYQNLKQWDKAISDYSRTIELDPNFDSAYSNRGIVYANLEQWDKAISDFSKAIKIDPNFELAYSNRGNVYETLKQWDKAVSDFSKAIEIDPNYVKAYACRTLAYENMGQWVKAIDDYTKVIELVPNLLEAYLKRGNAYGNIGQWDKAIIDYSKVLEFDPGNKNALSGRENAYKQLRRKRN
jgi:tetratricopeptide (TPR) repeat protein